MNAGDQKHDERVLRDFGEDNERAQRDDCESQEAK